MECLPYTTDQQRQECEKCRVHFETEQLEILKFAIRNATSSNHSLSSIGTSASAVTINTMLSEVYAIHVKQFFWINKPSGHDSGQRLS